jgi:hypothetical protein
MRDELVHYQEIPGMKYGTSKFVWKSSLPWKSFHVEYFRVLVKIWALISPYRLPVRGFEINSSINCKSEWCALISECPSA